MKYYIDFDNTLFNTESFYNDLLKIIKKYNISKKDIDLYYKDNLSNELFNPIKIINNLIKDKNINKEIKNFFKDLSKYLYKDTIDFLEFIKNDNELILLTYGDFEYQNLKVNKSLIKEYFNKIIVTSKNKGELDLDYKNSIFIDDSKEQIEGLLRKNAKVIRIKREGSKHFNDAINEVKEYNNLKSYVKDLEKNKK